MNRFLGRVLLLGLIAVPSFARVISYAPYTDRVASSGFQERTTRHFVLLEGSNSFGSTEIVLYDSTGAEEPRVIGTTDWYANNVVALYQKPGRTPVILTMIQPFRGDPPLPPLMSVSEGGENWHEVEGFDNFYPPPVSDIDTGGPFAGGLFARIAIGNDTWPFIVEGGTGVWAIGRNGTAKLIYASNNAQVIGRNAAGDRFLIRSKAAIWMTGFDGPATRMANLDLPAEYAGWITSSGLAYLEMLRPEGRFLFVMSGGNKSFVAGPYNRLPPAVGAPAQTRPLNRFFAVPTHDYEGAWIIQREEGKPTTLSLHTASGGLRTMWADASGPQVEALIAGPSGQSVLVQVHRERDGLEMDRVFLDPALAVWRVGQPAPRAYDELYLNEGSDKGFVHVDVDEIESGKPFVFNSGTQPAPGSPRTSPPIAGGGDVIQEWGVVRASLKQRLVIPGAARTAGEFGSLWFTDLTVYNPLDAPQQVEVRFIPLGVPVTAPAAATTTLTLDPLEIRAIPDALKSLFGLEAGGGTLHLLPDVGINATARTYSRSEKGTFGFGMQAIDFFNAAGPRFALTFAGAFPGEHFRTNLLLTDTSGRGAHALLTAVSLTPPANTRAGSIETPAEGTVQLNGLGPAFGLHSRAAGGLLVQPTRGTAIATVVAIDSRSNDATYFPPDLPFSGLGAVRAIPAIGHLDGAFGARFRSDLYIYNPTVWRRTLALVAKKWDSQEEKTVTLTLQPFESRVVPDALRTLFAMTGVARLHYSMADSIPGGVRLTSRTYSVLPDGATYGSLIPPVNNFQIGTSGDSLEILGISGGAGFRTNVGLVDLSQTAQGNATVRITILDDRSRVMDAFTVQVPLRGGIQINDIFGARGLTPPPAAMVIAEILSGQQITAYATHTDNGTNDSVYLGAQLGAQP